MPKGAVRRARKAATEVCLATTPISLRLTGTTGTQAAVEAAYNVQEEQRERIEFEEFKRQKNQSKVPDAQSEVPDSEVPDSPPIVDHC